MKDVAFSCDDNGAKFLCVTVWSLLSHYAGEEPIRINVFEGFGGHSAASKAALEDVVAKFPKASVRYHNVDAYIEPYKDILRDRAASRWNIFTWTPIFTPQILSDAEGNVAHFDIDMLFNDDVSKILDLDLGENLIACVAEYGRGDPVITEAVWGKGILPPEAERYFNTGTIVFNTAKCRAEKTWEKILDWYRAHYEIADRIEQDAWNALYWKRTYLLPLRWNFHDRLIKSFTAHDPRLPLWQGNPPLESLEAAVNPAILHFWGPKKPWKTCHRPYRKLYHAAMQAVGQTPPKEPLLAPFYNFANARHVKKVQQLQAVFVGKAHPTTLLKTLKRSLLLPIEWLGIGLGMLVLTSVSHRVLFKICDLLSVLMYRFDRQGRMFSLESLRVLEGVAPIRVWPNLFDPDKAKYDPTPREEKLIRGSYRNMARAIGHAAWTLRHPRRRVLEVGEMSPEGKAFLAANHPAITISAHLGCWEILSQLAYLEGHEMMSVSKNLGTPAIAHFLKKMRQAIGQTIIPVEGAFKSLMAWLRKGNSIGLLVDQTVSPTDGGLWVRFFSRPYPVSAAPAFFAAKAKAPIVIAWSRPLKNGHYRCEVLEVIRPEEAHDIWQTTQRCMATLERVIRRHPSCWVLNYDYFRYSPNEKMLADLIAREEARK